MDDRILITIKEMLGLTADYTPFDTEIMVHINSILFVLGQEGVGKEHFSITGYNDTWSDFLMESSKLEAVKTYVFLRVKMLFDPPSSSAATEAFNSTIKELEWRVYTQENQYFP